MKRALVFIVLIFCFSKLFGQNYLQKKDYRAEKIETPPVIDGNLDDKIWSQGEWMGGFTQYEPYENAPPSQQTEFKLFYDDNYIYVAIKAYDTSPDSIVNRMTRRDNISGDNLAVIFDSYNDKRSGFVFKVSSAGVKTDYILYDNGFNEDKTWDPVWFVRCSKFTEGWCAEIKIPLNQLRFNKENNNQWGFEVVRMVFRNSEMSLWQPIPRNSSGFIHQMGTLSGMEDMKNRKQADIIPFFVASVNKYEPQDGNPFATGTDPAFRIGLDSKFALSNNLILDYTLLPDFGQVEADPSQVNLSAFEIYYQEKRQFFVEGNSITDFKTGNMDNIFYSRRIGRRPQIEPEISNEEYYKMPNCTKILGAVKLTGKFNNGVSLGVLNAVTSPEYAVIDSSGIRKKKLVEPLTNYFLSRVQRDFNMGNTIIGGIFTNTIRDLSSSSMNMLHKMASVGGVDFSHYWKDKNWVFKAVSAFSMVDGSRMSITNTQMSSAHYYQRSDAEHLELDTTRTSLSGASLRTEFGKIGGNFNFKWINYWKSPGFEINDLGFMRRGDENLQSLWMEYFINKPFSLFRSISFDIGLWGNSDSRLNLLGIGNSSTINFTFKNLWFLRSTIRTNAYNTDVTLLRGGPSTRIPNSINYSISMSTNSIKKISYGFDYVFTKGNYNYMEFKQISGGVTFKPLNSLSMTLKGTYSDHRNELQYVNTCTYQNGKRYLLATLNQKILKFSLRVNYALSPDFSFEYWGQPYFASNGYSNYKMVINPIAERYEERFKTFDKSQVLLNSISNRIYIDENNNSLFDYSISKPDFSSLIFLSNLVMRWEIKQGSTLFFVWSQNREKIFEEGRFTILNDCDFLQNWSSRNIFLVKMSWRFGL